MPPGVVEGGGAELVQTLGRTFLLWKRNPQAAKIELPKAGARNVSFLKLDEMERLVATPDVSDETGLRDRASLEMLVRTGLRVSGTMPFLFSQIV